jgi:hypothetical protein
MTEASFDSAMFSNPPNAAPAPVLDCLTYACWVHAVPLRVKT